MEESFEKKLRQIDLIEIYDDIAEIPLSMEQEIQLCTAIPCFVDLRVGNVVYAVEEKYKQKLSNYTEAKRLKWLKLNLGAIIPNPEEKILKWQQKHNKNKKFSWLKRKLDALDYLSNELSILYNSEKPYCPHSLQLAAERRLSQHQQESHSASTKDIPHETSNCSTIGNTSSESVNTVIASQPKFTQESIVGENTLFLTNLRNVSISSISSSEELPSLCLESAIMSQEVQAQLIPQPDRNANSMGLIKTPTRKKTLILPLLHESEDASLQDEAYATFYQDMQVTSTQDFGL